MNIEELRQYTYDTKAERARAKHKASGKVFLALILAVVVIAASAVHVVVKIPIATAATAFVGLLVGIIINTARAQSLAKKPVPCGSCHKPMDANVVDYTNASEDFSLLPYDAERLGVEIDTADDRRTYLYLPPVTPNQFKYQASNQQVQTFSQPNTHAPSEPINSRPAIAIGTSLIQQEWFVCNRCQRAFVSRKFVFKHLSNGKAFGDMQAMQKAGQRLSGKKIRMEKG